MKGRPKTLWIEGAALLQPAIGGQPMASIRFTGVSGKTYLYQECAQTSFWRKVPGNYAFLDVENGVVYLGETKDFSDRRPGPSHEKWALAKRYDAVKVVAHENNAGEAARKAEEADLIAAYDPPANQQLRPKRPAAQALGNSLLRGAAQAPRKTLLGG